MVSRGLDPLQQKKKELAERRKEQLQEILKRGGRGTGRGGGGGLPPLPTVEQARQELAREQQARQEKIRKTQEEKVKLNVEKNRIRLLEEKLMRENAIRTRKELIDRKTRNRIIQEVLINNRTNERIIKSTNLDTGEIRTRTFSKNGGTRVRETGGFIQTRKPEGITQTVLTPKTIEGIKEKVKVETPQEQKERIDLEKKLISLDIKFKEGLGITALREKVIQQTKGTISNLLERNQDKINAIQESRVGKISTSFFDLVSGGKVSQSRINNREQIIFNNVDVFNKKYGNRELTQTEFNEAKATEKFIDNQLKQVEKDRTSLEDSTKFKIGQIVWGSIIPEFDSAGNPIIVKAGTPLPIIPAVSLPKLTKVSFLGTQTQKGNKIITDIVLKVGNKNVGIAKGVTIAKTGGTTSIVSGKTGLNITLEELKNLTKAELKTIKGKPFLSVDKDLIRLEELIFQGQRFFRIPSKFRFKVFSRIKERISFERGAKIARTQRLEKEIKLIRSQLFNPALKTLKASVRARRIRIIKENLNKAINELKKFKGVKRIKKIGKRVRKLKKSIKERISFERGAKIARTQRLEKEIRNIKSQLFDPSLKLIKTSIRIRRIGIIKDNLRKVINELKKFKGVKGFEKITNQIKIIINELKKFKVITRIKKIKKRIKFKKGARQARRLRLEEELTKIKSELFNPSLRLLKESARLRRIRIIKQNISKVTKELQKFKGFIRVDKIKKAIKDIIPQQSKLTFTKNIKRFLQESEGKLFVGGKKLSVEDIFSKASIFSKKDFDLIIGKTITKAGDRVQFRGLLLRAKDGKAMQKFTLNPQQKQQFEQALAKVVAVASSSVKAKSIGGLSQSARLAISSNIPGNIVTIQKSSAITRPGIISAVKQELPLKIIPKPAQVGVLQSKIKQDQKTLIKTQQRIKSLTKMKIGIKQKSKIKQKIKTQQRILTKQKTLIKQKIKIMIKMKILQKQKLIFKRPGIAPKVIGTGKPFILPFIIPKGKRKDFKKISSRVTIYKVQIRRKNKLINLELSRFTKNDALDYGSFRVDKGLARTFFLVPIGTSAIVRKLPSEMRNYYNKNKHKFRTHRKLKSGKVVLQLGFIEKRAYVGDQKSEIKSLNILRRKSAKIVKKAKTIKKNKIVNVKRREKIKSQTKTKKQKKVLKKKLKKTKKKKK